MPEFWTILRILFSLLFTVCSLYVTQFIKAVEEKKCPLSEGLYVSNGKLCSSLLMIIGAINIFVPINKFVANIPVIGSSYVLLFILLLFLTLFIVKRIVVNLAESENKKCNVKHYKSFMIFINERSMMELIYLTLILSILFFYV
jgi:hypothetical protein